MAGTGTDRTQPAPAASGWAAVGTITAYAAAVVAFGYALVSLYWAAGGDGLVSTVGGYVEQFARRGGQFRHWSPWRRRWRRWLAACSLWRWSGPGGGSFRAGGC